MCLTTRFITWIGRFIPQFILRLIVAWHAWDFGVMHYYATDKISPIQQLHPIFLFHDEFTWGILVWWPIIGAIFLVVGFRVRLVTFGLLAITFASIATHFPVNIIDFSQLPQLWHGVDPAILLFKSEVLTALLMLVLIFTGAGWLSIDGLTSWASCSDYARKSRKLNQQNKEITDKEKSSAKQQKTLARIAEKKQKKQDKKSKKGMSRSAQKQLKRDTKIADKNQKKAEKKQVKSDKKNRKKQTKITAKPEEKTTGKESENQVKSEASQAKQVPKVIAKQTKNNAPLSSNKLDLIKITPDGSQPNNGYPSKATENPDAPPKSIMRRRRMKMKKNIDDMRDVDFEANNPIVN